MSAGMNQRGRLGRALTGWLCIVESLVGGFILRDGVKLMDGSCAAGAGSHVLQERKLRSRSIRYHTKRAPLLLPS